MRLVLALSSILVLTAAAPAAAQTERPECAGADVAAVRDAATAEAAVLCIVNVERGVRGLPPVAAEARLDAASQGHSDDMAARGFFDHVTPEGRTPADRADAVGYPYASLYENIALGQTTARQAMLGWMRSTGHCHGVLAPDPVHLGVGVSPRGREGPLWTQMFGLTQDLAPPSQDTAPRDGCPYQRLSIAPGPATVAILALGRTGRRVTVFGRVEDAGAGRRIVIAARRGGREARKRILTLADGTFRTTLRAPRGRGRVAVTATAPAVPDVYKSGSDTRRV
ncbi:MAG TPA: CAP domain-containing protein [Solirubrobacteraceae bacterium]|nr:CAP domain-containing protein [Solirubrobacteraceae bacterium]